MINHVTLEVSRGLMRPEVEFWRLLGFERDPTDVRTDKYGAVWIRGRHEGSPTFLHLFPVPQPNDAQKWPIIPHFGHVALALGAEFGRVVAELEEHSVMFTDGTPYWGSRRVMSQSPSRHRVELMEFGPPQPEDWS